MNAYYSHLMRAFTNCLIKSMHWYKLKNKAVYEKYTVKETKANRAAGKEGLLSILENSKWLPVDWSFLCQYKDVSL